MDVHVLWESMDFMDIRDRISMVFAIHETILAERAGATSSELITTQPMLVDETYTW